MPNSNGLIGKALGSIDSKDKVRIVETLLSMPLLVIVIILLLISYHDRKESRLALESKDKQIERVTDKFDQTAQKFNDPTESNLLQR